MKLRIGDAAGAMEGYENFDPNERPGGLPGGLADGWPWPDNSIEELHAPLLFDAAPDKVWGLDEAWRVLVPGGLLALSMLPDPARHRPRALDGTPGGDQQLFNPSIERGEDRAGVGHWHGIKARFRVVAEMEVGTEQGRVLLLLLRAIKPGAGATGRGAAGLERAGESRRR